MNNQSEIESILSQEEVSADDSSLENKSEIININETYINYSQKKKTTPSFITKFEKAKILGIRSEMISNGSPPLVQTDFSDSYDIAKQEYLEKKIPLIIRRYLPNNTYEDWKLSDFEILTPPS